jgi:hypothetical protein
MLLDVDHPTDDESKALGVVKRHQRVESPEGVPLASYRASEDCRITYILNGLTLQ